jgi:transposase
MERLPMRKVKEILRIRWHLGRSVRETAQSTGKSVGVVQKTTRRAQVAKLTWDEVESLDEATLERRLYGEPLKGESDRPRPDPAYIHAELKKAGVTLELLHLEYVTKHPTGYRYTAFCGVYRNWLKRRGLWMRQSHKAGEKTFVDYSGVRPEYIDPCSGEVVKAELFVAVLGASNRTYAEATPTQRLPDWIGSHNRAVAFFGGATRVFVPDQLRSAVSRPCRCEPDLNRTYEDWARHYGAVVVPARPRKPKDKAKAEVAVQIAQRWILARLRNETFFSLQALNVRIRELVEELEARPMKRVGGVSRKELFARLDQPVLLALPAEPFAYCEWLKARVHPDYHVDYQKHWYSAPFTLIREPVELRVTENIVEVFHLGKRVAAHVRDDTPYKHTTDPTHRPPEHLAMMLDPASVLTWAKSTGPNAEAMVRRILEANPYREQGVRSAFGLMRMGEKHGAERTERACAHALSFGAKSYKPIKRILELGLEGRALPHETPAEATTPSGAMHENVRGPDYFH